jgi:hypothetical protein
VDDRRRRAIGARQRTARAGARRVTLDARERAAHRFDFEVNATLIASVCDRVVPGEELSAVVRDVSEGGVALIVADQRPRPGDLYRLDMRLFEGAVRQGIRVRSVRSAGHGTKVLGCSFTAISPDTLAAVRARSAASTGMPALLE